MKYNVYMNSPIMPWDIYFIGTHDTRVIPYHLLFTINRTHLNLCWSASMPLFLSSSFYLNNDNRGLHCQYNFNFTVTSYDIMIWDIHGYGYVRLFTSFSWWNSSSTWQITCLKMQWDLKFYFSLCFVLQFNLLIVMQSMSLYLISCVVTYNGF